jgi:hypothetical protein
MPVSTKLQVRRDTAATWTSTNPTLASGEIGFETDTLKFKIGNGSTAWTSLGYQAAAFNGGTITNALVVSNTSGVNTSGTYTSTIATGTAPFTVSSTTRVANLNVATSGTTSNVLGGATGGILYQSAANTTAFVTAPATNNSVLTYNTNTNTPEWDSPQLTMAVLMGYTSTVTAAGTTTLTNASTYYQQFTGTTTQTVVLPNTATLVQGWTFHIVNNSTANVTANTFGNTATVITIPSNTTAMVTCIDIVANTAAAWEVGLTDFGTYTGTGSVVMNTSPTLTTPRLANATTTATAGLKDFDGTVFYSTTTTTPGKALDVASYYYVSSAQYSIDATSASLPLSLLGASGTGITVAAGTTYEYEGLFVISATFIVTSQTPTINLISTTVTGSPVLAHQTVVESGNNATGLGSASALSAYRFTTTGIALTALTTGNRYYTVKMRGRIAVTGTGTIEVYPSIRFSAGSPDNAWIVEPGSIFRMTPIGNGTVTTVGTWA